MIPFKSLILTRRNSDTRRMDSYSPFLEGYKDRRRDTKECLVCLRIMDGDEFRFSAVHRLKAIYNSPYCRECSTEISRDYYEGNRRKQIAKSLARYHSQSHDINYVKHRSEIVRKSKKRKQNDRLQNRTG